MDIAQSPSASTAVVGRSPWHSPVPYLFGGLAAMLGLIAFALLVLACSYWRQQEDEQDLEAGEWTGDGELKKIEKPVFEERLLVILAGQQKPTCLATPIISSRASSFCCACNRSTTKVDDEKNEEEEIKTSPIQVEMTSMQDHDNSTNQAHQVS